MSDALRMLRSVVDGATTYFALSLGSNLLTLGLSLPFAAAITIVLIAAHASGALPLILPIALVVLPNPFAAGLHSIADQLAVGDSFVDLRDIWRRMGAFWWKTARAWLVGVAGLVLAGANIAVDARLHGLAGGLLVLIWLYVALAWLALHLYVYPVLMVEDGGVWRVYGRSLALLIRRPLFSMVATAGWLAVIALTCATGIILLLGVSLAAAIQHAAFRGATSAASREPSTL